MSISSYVIELLFKQTLSRLECKHLCVKVFDYTKNTNLEQRINILSIFILMLTYLYKFLENNLSNVDYLVKFLIKPRPKWQLQNSFWTQVCSTFAKELLKPVTRCDSCDACLVIYNVAFNIFIMMIEMNHCTDYFLALFFWLNIKVNARLSICMRFNRSCCGSPLTVPSRCVPSLLL